MLFFNAENIYEQVNLLKNIFKVENIHLSKRTQINIPGYQERVEFGAMTSFAYPVVGKGQG